MTSHCEGLQVVRSSMFEPLPLGGAPPTCPLRRESLLSAASEHCGKRVSHQGEALTGRAARVGDGRRTGTVCQLAKPSE